MARQRYPLRLVNADSASPPDTLLTANQPMPATSQLIPAGRMFPRYPKARRDNTIWH